MSISDIKILYDKHISGFYKNYIKFIKLHILIFGIYIFFTGIFIIFNLTKFSNILKSNLLLPLNLFELIYKPWTLVTYIFIQKDLLSLIFNLCLSIQYC